MRLAAPLVLQSAVVAGRPCHAERPITLIAQALTMQWGVYRDVSGFPRLRSAGDQDAG
jgi:hypothetical protein